MFQDGGLNVGHQAGLHLFHFGSSAVFAPFHDEFTRLVGHFHQAIDLFARRKAALVIDEPFLQLRHMSIDFPGAMAVFRA